jgi:hypothetical protein
VHKILGVMKLKMKEIIFIEQSPFSSADFRDFEIGSKKYQLGYRTFRNNISRLKKRGELELAFKSRPSFSILYQAENSTNDATRPYGGCQMQI